MKKEKIISNRNSTGPPKLDTGSRNFLKNSKLVSGPWWPLEFQLGGSRIVTDASFYMFIIQKNYK